MTFEYVNATINGQSRFYLRGVVTVIKCVTYHLTVK